MKINPNNNKKYKKQTIKKKKTRKLINKRPVNILDHKFHRFHCYFMDEISFYRLCEQLETYK